MPTLEFHNVAKAFGPAEVLSGVNLAVHEGEVLALVGENGAGKSTLMRIAAGLHPPGAGRVTWGTAPAPATLPQAEHAGITMVHQEFSLAPHLSVVENIFLGRELTRGPFLDRRGMARLARQHLSDLGSEVPVQRRLSDLPVSDWQVVELAKAFAHQPQLVLMDEPTAVLSATEAGHLFRRLRAFVAGGGAAIFTSHRLDEVKAIADRVAVLRDGRVITVRDANAITEEQMAEAMVGRPLSEIFPPRGRIAQTPPLLRVKALSTPGHVHEASFALHRGEVLGIAGLVGSGRTEMFEALLGLRPANAKAFTLEGTDRPLPHPREAWRLGLAYLTEDRKGKGLLLGKPLSENLGLTLGALDGSALLNPAAERAALDRAISAFDIRTGDRGVVAGGLSGGNQQKLLIAKTLAPRALVARPGLVVFDEPTRGVDIGAKQQIYQIIDQLAREGTAVVVISSEMQEIVGLSDRVLVMRQGRITGELTAKQITESEIIRHAMGLNTEAKKELDHV